MYISLPSSSFFFSSSDLVKASPPPLPPAASKCIYEHLRLPDGPSFGRFVYVIADSTIVTFLMILVILLLFIFTLLLFFFYFGSKKSAKKLENGGILSGKPNEIVTRVERNGKTEENVSLSNSCGPEDSEADSEDVITEKLILKDEGGGRRVSDCLKGPEDGKALEDVAIKTPEFLEAPRHLSPAISPEGSPKSTSSCISSSIPTDGRLSRPESLSESLSVLSAASSPPFFDFKRKTPEFVPKMMTEEFELLDRSIEKRRKDIRDLLRRIESTKRQHKRFSEHLQRVQHEHLLDY